MDFSEKMFEARPDANCIGLNPPPKYADAPYSLQPVSAKFIYGLQHSLPDVNIDGGDKLTNFVIRVEKFSKNYALSDYERLACLKSKLVGDAQILFAKIPTNLQFAWDAVRSMFLQNILPKEEFIFQRILNKMKQLEDEPVQVYLENYESLFYRANCYDVDRIIEREHFVTARCISGLTDDVIRNEVRNHNVNTFEELNVIVEQILVVSKDLKDFDFGLPSSAGHQQQQHPVTKMLDSASTMKPFVQKKERLAPMKYEIDPYQNENWDAVAENVKMRSKVLRSPTPKNYRRKNTR